MGDRGKTYRRWRRLSPLIVTAGLILALYQSWLRVPANLAPWGDVDLEQQPGLLARFQINSLAADSGACLAALDRSDLVYRMTPARPIIAGCGFVNVVHPTRSRVAYNRAFDLTCGMMAGLYWYEARLQELAQAHLGGTITEIDQLGTYACRNINGATSGRRSQHATANAIDIAAFHLADGRTVSIAKDWDKDTPQGRFLAAARDEACNFFNVVLSPNYNALHANHFHLDLGGFRMCR